MCAINTTSWPADAAYFNNILFQRSEQSIYDLPPGEEGRAFRLTKTNMNTLLFYAENDNTAQKWLEAFHESVATVPGGSK